MAGQKNLFKSFLKNKEEGGTAESVHNEEIEYESSFTESNKIEEQLEDSVKELEDQISIPVHDFEPEQEEESLEGERSLDEVQDDEVLLEADNTDFSPKVEEPSNLQISEIIEQLTEKMTAISEGIEKAGSIEQDFLKKIEEFTKAQQEIKTDFDAKLRYDQHKEQLIDKLHKELQQYKEDIVKQAMQPLIRDLIMVNDTIFKLVENYRSFEGPLDPEAILNHMASITTDIDDVLYRQGIEPFESHEEQVDSLKQKILKTIKVNDKEKEKLIAERLRRGYQWDEKIIRKEMVSVYVYDNNQEKAEAKQVEKGVEPE